MVKWKIITKVLSKFRDEATDDHMTTNLCINEIGNCQRLSVGANFVVFLCQKYGYRPIPSEILSNEFELLKRTLKEEHEDYTVLESWYTEDSNSVPAMHVLQPISNILVNFNNKRMPKLQKQDDTNENRQQVCRYCTQSCEHQSATSSVESARRAGPRRSVHREYKEVHGRMGGQRWNGRELPCRVRSPVLCRLLQKRHTHGRQCHQKTRKAA